MPYAPIKYHCLDCDKEVWTKNKRSTSVCKSCNGKRNLKKIREMGIVGNRLRPYEYAFNSLTRGAKSVNREVKITYEDFLIFTKIANCHYCKKSIPWTRFTDTARKDCNYYLDRMNNRIGYERSKI